MERIRRVKVAVIAAMALLAALLPSSTYAQLIDTPSGTPKIAFDVNGEARYDPGTKVFETTATPLTILFPRPLMPPILVNFAPGSSFAIRTRLNATVVGGVWIALPDGLAPGMTDACGGTDHFHDREFCIQGSVTVPGESTARSGILLTGVIDEFESRFNAGGTTHQFAFSVSVTGGALADKYVGRSLLVHLTSENSNFTGGFDVQFAGDAKGTVGTGLPQQAGSVCTGVIGDFVWNDLNVNGIQDAGEPGIPNVPVTLSNLSTAEVFSSQTDSSGLYYSRRLCAGTYRALVDTPEGHNQSPAGQGGDPALDSNPNPDSNVVLTSNDSVDLTIDFGFYLPPPPPARPFMTVTQGGWGSKPAGNNPGMLLKNNFSLVYPTSVYPLGVVIGDGTSSACPADGAAPYRINLTSASAVQGFLPQGSTPAALKMCQTNPTKKITVLAGQVLALTLNVDFSYAGVTQPGLGSLMVVSGPLAGLTVNDVLAIGNCMLSGKDSTSCGAGGLTLSGINDVAAKINENFDGGTSDGGYLAP